VIKSVFFSNQRVLEVYPLGWLVDRFSLETVGIEYHTLSAAAEHTVALPLLNIERKLSRVRNNTPFFPRITYNPFSRLCSATSNPRGLIHPVAAGFSRGLCWSGRNCMIQPLQRVRRGIL
jgi:hypothetical protein